MNPVSHPRLDLTGYDVENEIRLEGEGRNPRARPRRPVATTNPQTFMATFAASHDSDTLAHPFEKFAPVPEQGRLAQLFRRPDPRAASAAVERTLARLAPKVPSAHQVSGIYRHYRVSTRQARPVSIALWSRMFHHCRRHGAGSEEERRYLAALMLALNLQESDVEAGPATTKQ